MSNIKSFYLFLLTLLVYSAISVTNVKAQKLDGEYYIQSSLGDKYLDVQWGNSAEGTALHIWEFTGTNAQKFKLIWAEPGFYYIQSKLGRFVYADGAIPKQKALVKIGNKKGSDNFKWKLKSVGNGYYVFMNKAAMNMDVQWGVAKNGTPVWMWVHSGTGAQRWKLKSTTAETPELISITLPLPQPSGKTARINNGLWQTVFDLALKKIKIRINNFTSKDFEYANTLLEADRNKFRWFKPNDSKLIIPDDKAPYQKTFNVLPFRYDPMTIYIHDLNLSNARTSHENGKIKITMNFEENGIEIRTNCIDNFGCGGIGNPNFDFDNPKIEVLFLPIVKDGKITYENAEVRLLGHLNHVGVNVGVALMQGITDMLNFDINNALSKKGSQILGDYLNDPAVVRTITEKINSNINPSSLSAFDIPATITNVHIDNSGNLLISGK